MTDLSRSLNGTLLAAVEKGKAYEANMDYDEAIRVWHFASNLSSKLAASTASETEKNNRLNQANAYKKRAEELLNTSRSQTHESEFDLASAPKSEYGDELNVQIESMITSSSVTWRQIAGLDKTKSRIQSAIVRSIASNPEGVNLPKQDNLLFYGPAGCGKTILAAAAGNSVNATFYAAGADKLLSKWFGESSRLVSQLFQHARKQSLSFIFLDEFDSLAMRRDKIENSANRQVLGNILTELDGATNKSDQSKVLTVAATNAPWDLEPAVLDRFNHKIYIPPPDSAARKQIINLEVVQRGIEAEFDLGRLIERSEGFSGRQLKQACLQMIDIMIAELNTEMCNRLSEQQSLDDGQVLKIKPLTDQHLQAVLSNNAFSPIPKAELSRFEKWH